MVDESQAPATKQDMVFLQKDVTFLKKDVAFLQKDVTFLKKDVAFLQKDVTFLKKDVAFLKETLASREWVTEKLEEWGTTLMRHIDVRFEDCRHDYLGAKGIEWSG